MANLGKLLGSVIVLLTGTMAACNFGESGIAPPLDRIFLPSGIAPDPVADLLYVVNSNSDLRFNSGTIVAVDLAQVRAVLAKADAVPFPVCTKTRFSRTEPVAGNDCCRDLVDSNILNCNDPQFIQADATVALGSFGSAIELQSFVRDGETVRRLFVAVRAEPSITFADVTVRDGLASMRCTGPRSGSAEPQSPGAYCDNNWRLRRPSGVTAGALVLPEEPHVLALDDALGALFVGHLTVSANDQVQGGGVSTIDICHPEAPTSVRFAGLARTTFPPATLSQAVAGLSYRALPADASGSAATSPRLYATARYSATISGLAQRDPTQPVCKCPAQDSDCPKATPGEERDLTVVPAETFFAPTFLPHGANIRGIEFMDDGRAFVLHSDDPAIPSNPAALAVVDRIQQADGSMVNTPVGFLEMCSGPTGMRKHDAGRGDRLYVTCYDDGLIYVVDPLALVITAIIEAGTGPTSLVFSPLDPGRAYVASYASSHLSVIDLEPGSPTEDHVILRIGLPHGYGE